jgi:hypothetical protein
MLTFKTEITGELDALMHKPTSSTQLAVFLCVDSWWCELHDSVQCRARGLTFKFLFEFKTEFFSNFLFEFQVVRASNRSTIEGPLYISEGSKRSKGKMFL